MKFKHQRVDLRSFLGSEVPLPQLSPDLRQRVRHALMQGDDLRPIAAVVARELLAKGVLRPAGILRERHERVTLYTLPQSTRVYDLRTLLEEDRFLAASGGESTAESHSEEVTRPVDPKPVAPVREEPAAPIETPSQAAVSLSSIDAIRRTLDRDWVSFGLESTLESIVEQLQSGLAEPELRLVFWSERLGTRLGGGPNWRVVHDDDSDQLALLIGVESAGVDTAIVDGLTWLGLYDAEQQVVGAVGWPRVNESEGLRVAARTIESLLNAHRRSEQRVYSDPLTGLNNRGFFDHQLGLELERAQRLDQPMALLFVDIDFFKRINDEHGHDVGDLVLQHVSRLLVQHLRRIDQVFRWGGEEFALLLPGTARAEAVHTAERLRDVIENTPLLLPESGRVVATVSIGVAMAPEHAQGGERAILRRADQALYRAKDGGRNQVCLYGEEN